MCEVDRLNGSAAKSVSSSVLTMETDQNKNNVIDESPRQISSTIWARGGKRAFDVLISLLFIVILSPALILISLIIKLTSPGPVFFMQKRVGKDGVI